jgi:DNA-binding Lrp family transcriptional regulator
MKNREKQVLIEFLKNCKISDRQLAQKLNTSQSAITRTRKGLEKNIIKKYTSLPDFSKLNINIATVTFGECERSKKEIFECLEKLSNKCPRIIFAGNGEGMGKTCMFVSLHRDFTSYMKFKDEFMLSCNGIKDAIESFIISTKDSFQTFDLSKAVEDILKNEKEE